jgi:hypothetical protein
MSSTLRAAGRDIAITSFVMSIVTFWQVTIILSMIFHLFVCTAIQVAILIRLTPNFTITFIWCVVSSV